MLDTTHARFVKYWRVARTARPNLMTVLMVLLWRSSHLRRLQDINIRASNRLNGGSALWFVQVVENLNLGD